MIAAPSAPISPADRFLGAECLQNRRRAESPGHRSKRGDPFMRKALKRLIALLLILFLAVLGILAFLGYEMYRDALSRQSLENRVAQARADSNYLSLSQLPQAYLDAVVAVEDHRFWRHWGVDLIAIGRAAWHNLSSWSWIKGAAPLPSSWPKICTLPRKKSFIRKAAEVFMALALVRAYSKEDILELYVNSIYFGDGYYGIRQASLGYLGRSPWI